MEIGENLENKEKLKPLTYHHSRPLETVIFDVVRQKRAEGDNDQSQHDRESFEWLEKQIGFYPLFMSVGRTHIDLKMTAYWYQFRNNPNYRFEEDRRNAVLFSFRDQPPGGVYTDYPNWDAMYLMNPPHEHRDQDKLRRYDAKLQQRVEAGDLTQEEAEILSDELFANIVGPVPRKEIRSLFRPSWNKNDWITLANKYPNEVQYLVPQLDLSQADKVSVRNIKTKKILEKMGFKNVEVVKYDSEKHGDMFANEIAALEKALRELEASKNR